MFFGGTVAGAMRLFFALMPDDALRAALAALGRDLAQSIGGRAVPAHNVHLTLAFLGEVEQGRVPPLRAMLGVLPRAAFTLELDRIGEWHHAGVAWIAPSVVPPTLVALHACLDAALADKRYPVEARPFRPHVTLVRRRARALAERATASLEWNVRRVALVRSENVGGAVRYGEEAGVALGA